MQEGGDADKLIIYMSKLFHGCNMYSLGQMSDVIGEYQKAAGGVQ